MNATLFLVDTLFGLYLMVVILRLWLQMARADFYNPFSQFVVKATQPLIKPLRKVLPSIGPVDTASLVLALVISGTKLALISSMVSGGFPNITALVVGAIIDVVREGLHIVFWVLIIRAILSWVSQGSTPIDYVLHQLTEPFLAPIRKILPSMGGLDLSSLVAIVALQFIQILLNDFVQTLLR